MTYLRIEKEAKRLTPYIIKRGYLPFVFEIFKDKKRIGVIFYRDKYIILDLEHTVHKFNYNTFHFGMIHEKIKKYL